MSSRSSSSIFQVINPIIEAAEFSDCLTLNFGNGVSISVYSNSSLLTKKLGEYFKEFPDSGSDAQISVKVIETDSPKLDLNWTLKQPDSGKKKIKEEYVDFADGRLVRKRLTGVVFAMTQDAKNENYAIGPCFENSNQIINFINHRYIERCLGHGGVLGHAAGVELNGRGIALAGFSGMGKSSLALQLMSRGCRFVSNDRLVIRRPESHGGRPAMHGIAKHPRVNPGTVLSNRDLESIIPAEKRESLRSLTEDKLWQLEEKYDALIHEIYGEGRFDLSAPLDAVVILNWRRGSRELSVSRIELEQRRDLLETIIKQPGLFYRPLSELKARFSMDDFIDHLAGIPIYEFSGGVEFRAATDACLKILRNESID